MVEVDESERKQSRVGVFVSDVIADRQGEPALAGMRNRAAEAGTLSNDELARMAAKLTGEDKKFEVRISADKAYVEGWGGKVDSALGWAQLGYQVGKVLPKAAKLAREGIEKGVEAAGKLKKVIQETLGNSSPSVGGSAGGRAIPGKSLGSLGEETISVAGGTRGVEPPTGPKGTGKGKTGQSTGEGAPAEGGRRVQTGGRTTELKHDDWTGAEREYEVIRHTDDVGTIAQNTGWKEKDIATVKDHVFHNDHVLDERVGRFDADPEIANAWNRLQIGKQTSSDVKLLEHELFEARFESMHGVDYRTAHDAALRSGRPGL
jgi:hypothetical protein